MNINNFKLIAIKYKKFWPVVLALTFMVSSMGIYAATQNKAEKPVENKLIVVEPTIEITPTIIPVITDKTERIVTPKITATATPTKSAGSSNTNNNNNSSGNNPTLAPTNAPTVTPTRSPTLTPTPTPTNGTSPTSTPTVVPTATPTAVPPTATPTQTISRIYITAYAHMGHADQVVYNAVVKMTNKTTGEVFTATTDQNGRSPDWFAGKENNIEIILYKPRDWATLYCGSKWEFNTGVYGNLFSDNMRIYDPGEPNCILE